MPEPSTKRWRHAYNCLETMRANNSPSSIYKLLVCSHDAAELSWLLAALVPWAEIANPYPSKSGGKAPMPFATLVAKEGIKASNRVCDTVTGAFRHFEEISKFKQAVIAQENWTLEPDKLGMAIRRWDAGGGHWKLQVLFAILVEIARSDKSAGEDPTYSCSKPRALTFPITGFETVLSGWQQFLDHLREMDLMSAPSRKRLIDGTQLANALEVKPGRWMAAALDACMAWQFRNPDLSDLTGAVEEVRARAEELQIPLKGQKINKK